MSNTRLDSFFNSSTQVLKSPSPVDFKILFHNLQVYKTELEAQNEELRSAQEEILQSREKFSQLYDLAPLCYFTLDGFGIIKDCNNTALKMFGQSKSNLLGQRFQSLLHPSYLSAFYSFLEEVKVTEKKQSNIGIYRTSSGKEVHLQAEGVWVEDKLQKRKVCYLALLDITERRKAELQVKRKSEALQLALEASHTGTYFIDLKTNHIHWDKYKYAIYGLEPGSFDGKYETFLNLVHPEDRETMDMALKSCIEEKRELNIEYRIIRTDGTIRYLNASGRAILNEEQQYDRFTGITIDITDRKEWEKQSLKIRLEQEKKILNAVINTQEYERKRISESLHDCLGQLLYAVKVNFEAENEWQNTPAFQRIDKLLADAIQETRNISFTLSPSILKDYGLGVAIDELVERLSIPNLKLSHRILLSHRLCDNLEISIFRIIQELLNNIIRHSHATEASIILNEENENIYLNIRDNGTGFDLKEKNPFKGNGLYSIKNRIHAFHGEVNINSFPTGGTHVEIKFPNKDQ